MTNKDKLEKLKKLADAMYYAAQQLTTDASRLHKAMDEYHKFIINEYHKEEPISENKEKITYQGKEYIRCYHDELDEFANKYPKTVPPPEKKYAKYSDVDMVIAVKAGANWKEQQFKKNRLKHCNSITNEQAELEQGFIDQHLDKYQRMPTFLDAIEYGMNLQKEQMMKDAVDGTFSTGELADGTPIDAIFNFDKVVRNKYEEGEKVKLIVIKK